MAFAYILASVTYGLMCAICWLVMGGPALTAIWVYLIAGQMAMITLVGRAYMKSRSRAARRA